MIPRLGRAGGIAGALASALVPALALGLAASCLVACGLSQGAKAVGAEAAGDRPPGPPEPVIAPGQAAGTAPTERASVPGLRPGRAVLVEGARAGRGLPGFGQNAIERLSGRYAIASAPGYLSVEVWFTREGLLYAEPWRATACPGLGPGWTAYSLEEADGSVLWALSSPGYRLLARFPSGYASGAIPGSPPGSAVPPEPCRFLSTLADRFSFFHRYAERPEDVSFPAFLDIPGR